MSRPDLPFGTVTFLHRRGGLDEAALHELGAEPYAEALATHRRTLRGAFTRHGGVEVDTQGDAFFVAFRRPALADRFAVIPSTLISTLMESHHCASCCPERITRVRLARLTRISCASGMRYQTAPIRLVPRSEPIERLFSRALKHPYSPVHRS